jgi:hypothetical protein
MARAVLAGSAVLRHAVLLALVSSLGVAVPARAERAWPARLPPAAKKLRRNPGRLGRGFMSDVFISRDGRHVIKKVKPTLGGVVPLGREARAMLAARSVTIMDVLRRAGLPVPAAVVPPGHPDMIVQEFAGEGAAFGDLHWSARPRALASAFGAYRRAVRAVRRAGMRGVLVDPKIANFKFAPEGRLVSWFDPAGVGGPWHWVTLRSRMLVRRLFGRR